MNKKDAVKALLASAGQLAALKDKRGAWVRKTAAAWRKADEEMHDRLCQAVERLSEEEFERLCDEEQARVDAIRAPLEVAAERDVWPKHLYFGGI